MRQAEKLRSGLIALILIFLYGQVYSTVVKADFWKSFSGEKRGSCLSDGSSRLTALPECFSDAHSGLSDDSSSTVFIPAFVPRTIIKIPETFEKIIFYISPGLSCITKYRRSVIAIQTVK
jgi:hypothetical protein